MFEALKGAILSGRYSANGAFPSETQLVRRFSVSRQTVQHALRELEGRGYIVRRQGRATRVVYARGRRIGLIPCVGQSEFFCPLAARLSHLCQTVGCSLLFATAEPDSDAISDPGAHARRVLRIARDFVEQNVSGVLYQPVAFLDDAADINARILSVFDEARIPVVLIDYDIVPAPDRSAYDLVGIDNVEAGVRLAAHLVEQGARTIHFVQRPTCSNAVRNRLRGVALGTVLAGLPWDDAHVLRADPEDAEAVRRHFARRPRPDAVVCGYDTLAIFLEKNLQRVNLPAQGKMLLAGVDDRSFARALQLTTIHQPVEDIADAAFDRLLRRMKHPELPVETVYLPAPLVVRRSTDSILRERKGK